MAEPIAADDPQGDSRRVDTTRVLQKLQALNPELVQLAMLQVVVEDQDETIKKLQAELVAVTSGADTTPARP